MIRFFPKSRRLLWIFGMVLGGCGGLIGWFLAYGRIAGLGGRAAVTALTAFLGVSLAVYAARFVAMREYQGRLLYLYEELDPRKFLEVLLPLCQIPMNASARGTLLLHIANGYLYSGEVSKALDTLTNIETPESEVELPGMILSNQISFYLASGQLNQAEELLRQLHRLIEQKECTKEFSQRMRRAIAYQNLGLAIQKGEKIDVSILERDFSTSHSPLHKLDVQYQIALFHWKQGQKEPYRAAREYVYAKGGKTVLPLMLPDA